MTSCLEFLERSDVRQHLVRARTSRKFVRGKISSTRALQMGVPLTRSAGQALHLHEGDVERKRRAGSHLLVGLPPCVGV